MLRSLQSGIPTTFLKKITIWSRKLWEQAGSYLDESLELAIDAELWARFFQFADLYAVSTTLGGFRYQQDSKSGLHIDKYFEEMFSVLKKYKRDVSSSFVDFNYINKFVTLLTFHRNKITYSGKVVKWDLKSE